MRLVKLAGELERMAHHHERMTHAPEGLAQASEAIAHAPERMARLPEAKIRVPMAADGGGEGEIDGNLAEADAIYLCVRRIHSNLHEMMCRIAVE